MRSIPNDILNKINKLLQTQAENADPKIELVMQRTKRYIERGSELQVTDVRQGPNLGAMDLGLRRENHLKAPDMVYMIYIMEGIAKAARQPYLDSIEKKGAWEYLFDIGPAVDVAIEFDGYWMPASKDAEICFDSPANWTKVTAGEPWYFRVLADGSLTAQQGATGDSITLAPTGVTKVSAVRGWKSVATGSLDQGLIVAYIKDGTVCYRNYAEQADGNLLWESEKTVPELGTAVVNLAVFRTNDYRSGIIAEDAGTLKWVITSRNWAGMATPPERLEVSLEDLKLKLQPIMQLLIGDGPYPTNDKRHWGTKAEWPAEKISVSLEDYAPMLLWASDTMPVSVENVPINDEIEDEALGTGDGTIKVYGLAHVPIDDEDYPVVIYIDEVEAGDYAINGKILTFDTAPESGAAITADYTWDSRKFTSPRQAAADADIENLKLAYLPRINVWTTWNSGLKQRLGHLLLKQEVSKYLVDGNITFRASDPGADLRLTLENPAGIIAGEDMAEIPPGMRVSVYFRIGDSDRYALGNYYLDRIVMRVGDAEVSLNARNATNKLLKDQTFNEYCNYPEDTITNVVAAILDMAGVVGYRIQQTNQLLGVKFTPSMTIFEGLMQVISVMPGWQIREDVNGTILVGDMDFVSTPGIYYYERGRDCFSREVVRDDRETYARVCVHGRDFIPAVYRDVDFSEPWNLPKNKTLYLEVPKGTSQAMAEQTADYFAYRLSKVGLVETFLGPIRPHLQPGDRADVMEPGKLARTIGTITQVEHSFGRDGFYSEFTADSGGVIRKPMIRDLIEEISGKKDGGLAERLIPEVPEE